MGVQTGSEPQQRRRDTWSGPRPVTKLGGVAELSSAVQTWRPFLLVLSAQIGIGLSRLRKLPNKL